MLDTFAARLKSRRMELKLTQADLENLSGIPKHTIGNFEQGITPVPGADKLLQLADILDVSPHYLLYGGNDMLTNTYTESIKRELMQIRSFEQIKKIKKAKLNGSLTPRLMLSDEVINDIVTRWNCSNVFDETDELGKVISHKCYRNYVEDVIIKYCQNRHSFREEFDLRYGLEEMNEQAGLMDETTLP